tara:strand:- start:182 stop:721 length:540 start_codon:yes stop_codon:yes gene_type:complete
MITTNKIPQGQLNSEVSQTITNGVTNKAPSEDAVFDALALKANNLQQVTLIILGGSPADGLTYFHGRPVVLTQNTSNAAANNIYLPTGCTSIKYVSVSYMTQSVGSNELVSSYVRVSNTTDYTISTNIDLSNQVQFREYTTPITGLTAGVDYLQIKTVCPTWVTTNPTSITMIVNIKFE